MCAPQPQSWYDLISRGGGSVNEITVIAEDVSRNKEAEKFSPSFAIVIFPEWIYGISWIQRWKGAEFNVILLRWGRDCSNVQCKIRLDQDVSGSRPVADAEYPLSSEDVGVLQQSPQILRPQDWMVPIHKICVWGTHPNMCLGTRIQNWKLRESMFPNTYLCAFLKNGFCGRGWHFWTVKKLPVDFF